MKSPVLTAALSLLLGAAIGSDLCRIHAAEAGRIAAQLSLHFQDDFKGKLGPGWSWLREDTNTWKTTEQGLEIRIQPGNMWGPPNDGKNLLMRPLPEQTGNEISVSVKIEHYPTEQYEQVDLTWYYDDSHMVKIGEELVDGKLSVVMGREEKDRTRTIAIIPLDSNRIETRLTVKDGQIRGEFRKGDDPTWITAGTCDLPAKGAAKACIMCYQGTNQKEHWAKLTSFKIQSTPSK